MPMSLAAVFVTCLEGHGPSARKTAGTPRGSRDRRARRIPPCTAGPERDIEALPRKSPSVLCRVAQFYPASCQGTRRDECPRYADGSLATLCLCGRYPLAPRSLAATLPRILHGVCNHRTP